MIRTLCFDIGGSRLKAALVAPDESFLSDQVVIDTPNPIDPPLLMEQLQALASQLPPCDRIAAGFPGVVRRGIVRTAANLGTEIFAGFDLQRALEKQFGKPARVANDADVQGLGAITGHGMEVVITLGTGFGTGIFEDGVLGPHIELAHHPFRNGETYEGLLGDAALERDGEQQWCQNLLQAIVLLRALTTFDHLYIGGGNARLLDAGDFADDVSVIPNREGISGGVWLWETGSRKGGKTGGVTS